MNKNRSDKEILSENKKFQLERIGLFSDAVFAIAITLLIIELKIPEVENETASQFLHSFMSITNRYIGFLFSFIFIGMYWVMHHKIFYHLKDFDKKLINLNLAMLLFIVIIPFSTSISFEHMTFPDYPFMFYALNHIAISSTIFLLWNHLSKCKNISVNLENARFLKYKKTRSIIVILTFCIVIFLGFFSPILSRFAPIIIAPSFFFLKRKFKDVSTNEF